MGIDHRLMRTMEILAADRPWHLLSDLKALGHADSIPELIDLGLAVRWGQDSPEIDPVVTLTPYGAWVMGVVLAEYVDGDPIWVHPRRDSHGDPVLTRRAIRITRHSHEKNLGWLRSFELIDPAPGPDYMADEEGKPVMFRGRPIPIDRRMGRKKAKKVGRKARR